MYNLLNLMKFLHSLILSFSVQTQIGLSAGRLFRCS